MGKTRMGKKGPGGTRETVGGLSLWSPAQALPGRFGTSSTRAARRLSKGRPRHAPGLLWEGNTKKREKHVFRFDGGGRQLQDVWASQELPGPSPLASASEHSISREEDVAQQRARARGWEPWCRGHSQGAHTRRRAQGLDKCQDASRTHLRASASGQAPVPDYSWRG